MKNKQGHKRLRAGGIVIIVSLLVLMSFAVSADAELVAPDSYARLQPITSGLQDPSAVALDPQENVYVVETNRDMVHKYSQSGEYLATLYGLNVPSGIAVDSRGRIYVGNEGSGNVEIYNAEFELIGMLGTGDWEFRRPVAIATDSANRVYVADSRMDKVNVYSAEGAFIFSFDASDNPEGGFHKPTSVTIDEIFGEIVVADLPIIYVQAPPYDLLKPGDGARVQFFNMQGEYQRGFGEYGSGEGQLIRPRGVAVDAEGQVYVADAGQHIVQVFDNNGGFFYTVNDSDNQMRSPLGIAMGKSNRLFIASYFTYSVEVYGMFDYIQMQIMPKDLSFAGQAGGTAPALQAVEINNTGTKVFNWSATSTAGWITIPDASGMADASSTSVVNIGVDLTGLEADTVYAGTVEISAESGATETVAVALSVSAPAELSVSPLILGFSSEQGAVPSAQDISINFTGGEDVAWSATSSVAWIGLDKYSGAGSGSISVSADISGMNAGIYDGSILIMAGGAAESPALVTVALEIIIHEEGTIMVTTDPAEASFTIIGTEASYTGSGPVWQVTDAPAGEDAIYSIIFHDVEGYITPSGASSTLYANGTITFDGNYEPDGLPVTMQKNIIVGAGPGADNDAIVKVLYSDGSATGVEFNAYPEYKYGVNVAAGDIDGDGIDEIITGAGPGPDNLAEVRVFDGYGTLKVSVNAYEGYTYGVNVASGDIDGDGRDEIITGAGHGVGYPAEVRVFVYDPEVQGLVDSGIAELVYNEGYGVKVAAGDVNGDGVIEIITAQGPGPVSTEEIKIWKVDTSSGVGQWRVSLVDDNTPYNEFFDDFDDEAADKWDERYGKWAVEDGEYSETDWPMRRGNDLAFSLIDIETKDMTIEVDAKHVGTGGQAHNFFIIFAHDESEQLAYWAGGRADRSAGGDMWTIEKWSSRRWGPWSAHGYFRNLPETIDADTWYHLKIVIRGDTVTLFADGVKKVSYTFPEGMPKGKIGLGGQGNHAHFDNFKVTY